MRRLLHLSGQHRTASTNRLLGGILAFNAGAINAGGFLVVHMYTSHMTGIITDIGIELGKLFYWNRTESPFESRVRANQIKLKLLLTLLAAFVFGGLVGAAGFRYIGFIWVVPLAILLLALSLPPLYADLLRTVRRRLNAPQ